MSLQKLGSWTHPAAQRTYASRTHGPEPRFIPKNSCQFLYYITLKNHLINVKLFNLNQILENDFSLKSSQFYFLHGLLCKTSFLAVLLFSSLVKESRLINFRLPIVATSIPPLFFKREKRHLIIIPSIFAEEQGFEPYFNSLDTRMEIKRLTLLKNEQNF